MQNGSKVTKKLQENVQNLLLDYEGYSIHETSFYGLRPGDLITFRYDGIERFGLVVRSRRTQSGYFLSTRNNTLLNVFQLESLSSGLFESMVNNLYRNRVRCTYRNSPKILGAFLGSGFRTFNVAKIQDIRTILIQK